jgi:hypothetical protein
MPMKLKKDDKGQVVVIDDKPVYIHDDGKELPFDAEDATVRIRSLNAEAKTHREAKEAAELKLKGFEGITDVEAARKALETVKNLDDGKLVAAGKVEEVKAAATREYQERLRAAETAHATALQAAEAKALKLTAQLDAEMIGGAFQRSPYIKDKVAIPADIVQAMFGRHFKVNDGKLVAQDASGNALYSRARPGDSNVDFEEAIEMIIGAYPQKQTILKGSNATGGGKQPDNGSPGAGGKTMKRSEWNQLPPAQQGLALKDTVLVD